MFKKSSLLIISISFIMTLLLSSAVLAAAVEINMWTQWTTTQKKAFTEEIVKAFEKENPDIKVNIRGIPNDMLFQTIRTGLSGANPPDIFQHDGYQQTRDYASKGLALDLSDWWEKYGDRFVPSAKGSNNLYEGSVYAIPWDMAVLNQMYYNKKMLKDVGVETPPRYWEDFMAICDKFKDKGIFPIALGNKAGWPGMHWLQQFILQTAGADKINKILHREEPGVGPRWTDPDVVRGAEYFEMLANEGYFMPGAASSDYQLGTSFFMAGKAPFFNTGSWFIGGNDFPPELEWGVMQFPVIKDEPYDTDMTISFLGNYSVAKKSKHKEEALKFLEFLSRKHWGERWTELTGQISTLRGAVTEETAGEKLMKLIDMADTATASITFMEGDLPPSVGEDKLYNGSIAVLTGEMTAKEWMESVEAEHQRVLENK